MKRCTETDSAIMRCPDYPWKCEMCGAYKEPTNADHIRSLSDEELAEFIATTFENGRISVFAIYPELTENHCGLDWLREAYKEEV